MFFVKIMDVSDGKVLYHHVAMLSSK